MLNGTMLSILAVSRKAGSKRSTSGANVASRLLVGGIGPANTPVSASSAGGCCSRSSGWPSSPDTKKLNSARSWLGAGACGNTVFVSPDDSSDTGPDFRLLMSKAVTL